jgi:signal transduction histidine kinase
MAFTSKFEELTTPNRHWETNHGDARSFDEASTDDDLSIEGSRARLAFYEKLADDAPGALFQLERRPTSRSPDYQFTFVATGVHTLLGVSSRALEADPFGWLRQTRGDMGEDARSTLLSALEQSAAALTPLVWQGCVHTHQGDRWVQAQARPSSGPEGRVRWTGVLTDITDQKLNILALEGALAEATELGVKERLRAEALRDTSEDLMEAHGQAVAARERVVHREKAVALARLARGLAHEINNPLSGMQHMLEALREPPGAASLDDARRAVYLNLMQAGLVRIESTVSNLLQYAQDNAPLLGKVDAGVWVEEALAQPADTRGEKYHPACNIVPHPATALGRPAAARARACERVAECGARIAPGCDARRGYGRERNRRGSRRARSRRGHSRRIPSSGV